MIDRGIYWATTAGNHDGEGDVKMSRKKLS
jgi:hypothetical protein